MSVLLTKFCRRQLRTFQIDGVFSRLFLATCMGLVDDCATRCRGALLSPWRN